MANNERCVAHRYRPSKSLCKACGKGICEECERIHSNLCPSCANIPGGNTSRFQSQTIRKEDRPSCSFNLFPGGFSFPSMMPSTIQGKAGPITAGILIVALAFLVVLGFKGIGPFPFRTPRLSSVDYTRVIKENLYLAVVSVDAFKKRTGRLPTGLEEVGMAFDKTLSYQVVSPTHYLISKIQYGQSVSYDSAQEASVFFAEIAPPFNPSVGNQEAPAGK